MKSATPSLLPLLRSASQGDVMAWVMLHPDQEFSMTQLADAVGISVPTAMREADRLVASGLVRQERRGNTRLIQAETDNVVYPALADLMSVTFGPLPVLRDLLGPVAGIREAFIYGSWAARYRGEAGPVPDDVDVLVIGSADLDELDDVAERARRKLGREVSIRRVRPHVWDASDNDAFRSTIMSRPVVTVMGDS